MWEDVTPILALLTTGGSSARSRCTRPGAPSNGFCMTHSTADTGSASYAIATTTRAAPAPPAPARRPSGLLAASPAIYAGTHARRAVSSAAPTLALWHDRHAAVHGY